MRLLSSSMVLILKSIPMVVMKLVVKVSSEKRRRRQLFPTPAKEEEEEEEAEIQVHFRLQRNALKKTLKIKAL